MKTHAKTKRCFIIISLLIITLQAIAQEESSKILIISPRVGEVVDQTERENYKLFPGMEGFQSAQFFQLAPDSFKAEIKYLDSNDGSEKIKIQYLTQTEIRQVRELIDHFDQIKKGEYTYDREKSDQTPQINFAIQDTIVTLELNDGSSFNGKIMEELPDKIIFHTVSGLEITIPKSMVKKIKALEGKMVEGKYYRLDPNYSRLLFAPTGRPLKKGHGYFSDYYVFFPGISYGFTNYFTLMAGFSFLPGLDLGEQLKYFAPKFGGEINEKLAVSVGALYITVKDVAAGIGFSALTLGERDKSFTLGLGLGYIKEEEKDFEFAKKPILMLGGNIRLSNSVALVSENWFILGEEFRISTQPFSIGVRFFGEHLSGDVALIIIGEVIQEGFPIPWLSFVYNFGN